MHVTMTIGAMIIVVAGTSLGCTSSSDGAASREEARSIARADAPCASDLDCCVVDDPCIEQALVVRASDKDKVASLVAEPGPEGCTQCILPAVQVSCVQGLCAGVVVDTEADGGTDFDTFSLLTHDHCGPIAGVASTTTKRISPSLAPRSILGCGPH
jgi:hypothetical protein